MYQYTQFRHESKKWFSRVYLVLINLVLFGLAVCILVGGYTILKVVNNDGPQLSETAITMEKDVAIGLLIIGAIIVALSFLGTIGACTRHSKAEYTFFVQLQKNAGVWDSLTLTDWKETSPVDQDAYQSMYECCGFGPQKSNIYAGPPLFGISVRTDGNKCASATYVASVSNCYDSGNAFYHYYFVVSASIFTGVLVFMLTAIGAADQAKMKTADVGYQVAYEMVGQQ